MTDGTERTGKPLSFDQVADALTPQLAPGVSRADLFAALTGSRVAPAGTTCAACSSHGVLTAHSPAGEEHATWTAMWARDPEWTPPGWSGTARQPGTRWCVTCQRPEPLNLACPEVAKAQQSPLPADPFPEDMLAGLGIAQMLEAMEAGGVPPLRAERIVGAMLAAHGMMHKEAEGEQG